MSSYFLRYVQLLSGNMNLFYFDNVGFLEGICCYPFFGQKTTVCKAATQRRREDRKKIDQDKPKISDIHPSSVRTLYEVFWKKRDNIIFTEGIWIFSPRI